MLLCVGVWWLLTRTRVGMVVRAATERPELTRALGIDVGRWVTPVFGFGVALAALAGVLAAPMRAVNPLWAPTSSSSSSRSSSSAASARSSARSPPASAIGLLQAWSEAYGPALLAQTLVFLVMALVLLLRPAGLFGREELPT